MQLEHLHMQAAELDAGRSDEAQNHDAADLAVALRIACPPASGAFARGQCVVHLDQRCLDSDSMQDVHRDSFSLRLIVTAVRGGW